MKKFTLVEYRGFADGNGFRAEVHASGCGATYRAAQKAGIGYSAIDHDTVEAAVADYCEANVLDGDDPADYASEVNIHACARKA